MVKKTIKRATAIVITLMLLFSSALLVSAENDTALSYSYWKYNDTKTAVDAKTMFSYKATITASDLGLSDFTSLNDIVSDSNGNLYIADTANNRIVITDRRFQLICEITSLTSEKGEITLNAPEGIYVSVEGLIYICNTGGANVLICDINGNLIDEISAPNSELLPSGFSFMPSRVLTDSKGYVYVLSKGCYYGALLFTPELEFCLFYGANETKGTVLDAFEKIKNLVFGSNEKESASLRRLPYQFNDFVIKDDFVYTVTRLVEVNGYNNSSGQIRKLNPGGSNILYASVNGQHISSTSYKFQDEGCYRGIDATTGAVGNKESDFVGIEVDNYGNIYALDSCYGKIFVYDSECNFLCVFGGGYSEGEQAGIFTSPTAICVNEDLVYVADEKNMSITVFERNSFGNSVFLAQSLTLNGNYKKAAEIWKQVLKQDRASQLAYEGLSKYEYSVENYEAARDYAKQGYSQNLYAKAQQKIGSKFISANFFWVFPLIILAIFGIFLIWKWYRKRNYNINEKIGNIPAAVFHPFNTFERIRYFNAGSAVIATILLCVYAITSVIASIYNGFSFSIFEPADYNSVFTVASTSGLVLLWVMVSWLVCSLLSGKGNLKQVYIANGYCMTPLILLNISKCILSNVLLPSQQTVITVITILLTGYTLFIICIASMKVHEYNFFEFAGTSVITILGMVLVVFIIFLIFILGQEAITFVVTIFKEITTR